MEPSTLWFITLIVSYFFALIQLFALYRFKSIEWLLIIEKRYPKLVIFEAVGVCSYLIIGHPLFTKAILAPHFIICIPDYITSIFGNMLYNAVMLTEVTRLWLISFDLHYLHSSKNSKWKSQINASFASNDWYLKNKQKYGSQRFMITIAFIYYVIVTISASTACILFCRSEYPWVSAIVNGTNYSIQIGIVFWIYFRCRKYNELQDNLLFFYEIRATAFFWLLCLLIYFCIRSLYRFDLAQIATITWSYSTILTIIGPSLLSTLWIPRQIFLNKAWKKELVRRNAISIQQTAHSDSVNVEFYKTLRDEQRFEVFVQWMYREFSSEAALCFIEMAQFKERLVEYLTMTKETKEKQEVIKEKYVHLFYEKMPKSDIVYAKDENLNDCNIEIVFEGVADESGNFEDERFKIMARLLYNKYIKRYSEFEVNISSQLRTKYAHFDEVDNWNMDMYKLMNVFDGVLSEMFFFMRQSFMRYQRSMSIS